MVYCTNSNETKSSLVSQNDTGHSHSTHSQNNTGDTTHVQNTVLIDVWTKNIGTVFSDNLRPDELASTMAYSGKSPGQFKKFIHRQSSKY